MMPLFGCWCSVTFWLTRRSGDFTMTFSFFLTLTVIELLVFDRGATDWLVKSMDACVWAVVLGTCSCGWLLVYAKLRWLLAGAGVCGWYIGWVGIAPGLPQLPIQSW